MRWRVFRSGLQTVHLWVGLIFSIPFILIGLSGSIIVLIQAMPELSMPAAIAIGEQHSLAEIIAAAKAAAPADAGVVNAVVLPERSRDPVQVQFGPPPGTRPANVNINNGLTLFVDPVSLKILGDMERRRAGPFMRWVTTLHIAMLAPGYFGLQFVGFMGVLMVLFGVSGLVLWWPKKGQWRYALLLKQGVKGFRFHRDLHSVIGFWSLFVFLVISLSGVELAFPVTFQDAVGRLLPLDLPISEGTTDAAVVAAITNPDAMTADDAAKLALAAVSHAWVSSIQLPLQDGPGVFMVAMNGIPYSNGSPQISVFIGPGAQVSGVVDPRAYSLGKRLLGWLRVLHYGQGWGDVWRVLVFFSGFLPLLFAITGLRMWQLKRGQRTRLPQAVPVPAE